MDFAAQLITWELALLLISAHAVATAAKRMLPNRVIDSKRFKAALPVAVVVYCVAFVLLIAAPDVLVTTAQRVTYGLAVGALWPHVVRIARSYSERYRSLDDSIAGRESK